MMRIGVLVCAAAAAAVAACGSNPLELQGNVRIDALFNVPAAGVNCIRLVASGMKRSVQKDFVFSSGQASLGLEMQAIPTGTVMFSGTAFAETCIAITATSIPTWVADDVTVTIPPGPAVAVALTFHPNGNAAVAGNFIGDSFAVTTLAGLANSPGSADAAGAQARFAGPEAIAFDGADSLYLSDRSSTAGVFSGMTIRRVTISTGAVVTLAGAASALGTADGDGATARFTLLQGVALSPSGSTLYVADRCVLRALSTAAPYTVTTLLGTAADAQNWTCPAGVGSIVDVAVRGTDLYVADQVRATVSKISLSAVPPTVATVAGTAGTSGAADGALLSARFLGPQGIAFSGGAGDPFFVSDWGTLNGGDFFGLVRRLSESGNTVTTLAGAEQMTGGTIDGLRSSAFFAQPRRVASDGSSVFVTDLASVRRLDLLTGAVVTIAGSSAPGSADGVGAAAGFRGPSGIARNAATGAMYVADQGNFTVRVLTP
jgi:DNA-binding beta-propeller fold protein YncE